jgi:hypothetical protein
MISFTYDFKDLERAIKRNPQVVANETKDFLTRAGARLQSKAGNNPWRVGSSGGGVPVATGNLLRTHELRFKPFSLRFGVMSNKAPYASAVHKKRPWLVWVKKQSEKDINEDSKRLLRNITDDLGK